MAAGYQRGGKDTYVDDSRADKNFSGANAMIAAAGGGANPQRLGLIRMNAPVPPGATIIFAVLVLTQGAAVASNRTVRLSPLTEDTNFGNVDWNHKPTHTVTGESVVTTAGPIPASHQWWFDVTAYIQGVANGAPNLGWKIRCDEVNGLNFATTENPDSDIQPFLSVAYSTAPSAPTRLKPSGTYVSTSKPVVSCDYTDRSGNTQLQSIQVQIDPGADFAGGDLWDSGEVPVNQPALDLSATSYPGLDVGAFTWWRVRVKDGDNNWSDWSEATFFGNAAKGDLAITKPGVGGTVTEFTPPTEWTFTSTQTHFQVQVTSPDGVTLFHDSGKIQSPILGYTIPKRVLTDGTDYRLVVYVWDDVARESTQGDPSYVQAERIFHVDFDAGVTPPAALDVTQVGITPFVQLEWSRATDPNSFTILRDDGGGEFALDTDIAPSEVEDPSTPGVYRWIDWSVMPAVAHTYRVRAEVAGALSDVGPTATITTSPEGIWLVDPGTHEYVVLGGKDGVNFSAPDNAQVYNVLGSLDVIRVVMGLSGLSGSCQSLLLRTREGIDWTEYQRRVYGFKERPAQTFRLVMGDLNIPVILGNVVVAPHPETRGDQVLKQVSFDWWQVAEHPFSGTL